MYISHIPIQCYIFTCSYMFEKQQGVQRMMAVLVVNFYLSIFDVAICDLVHDVEAIHDLC